MDVTLEFIYQFHPNFSLAIGTGYISRMLNGSSGLFSSSAESDSYKEFSLSPELRSEINPLYLSCIFSFPVMGGVKANFIGGIGYYIGNIKCTTEKLEIKSGYLLHLSGLFESNAHSLGFHAGAGVDFDLSLNLFLSVEALYRVVNFTEFKTHVIPLSGSAFFLLHQPKRWKTWLQKIQHFFMNYSFLGKKTWEILIIGFPVLATLVSPFVLDSNLNFKSLSLYSGPLYSSLF
jgi:hypothetical protein